MAQLIPMYHWQDREDWLVLEALGCARQPDTSGWSRVSVAWYWWQILRDQYHCPKRGGGISTFRGKLKKFRILGWVESRPNPQSAGKTIRGQERVEWRLKAGLKVGLWESHTAEAKTRWICT